MSDWTSMLAEQDFSAYSELLAVVPVGEPDEGAKRLLAALFAMAGPSNQSRRWSLDDYRVKCSLYGVEITYNGLNTPELGTAQNHTYALGVLFPASSEAPMGQQWLLWSDPVVEEPEPDPEVPEEPPEEAPQEPEPEFDPDSIPAKEEDPVVESDQEQSDG